MEKDNVFRLTCSCGCGDGFEAKAAHGTLYVSFFRSDWYAQQHAFRSAVTDKMKYMKGNRLLREVLVSREDLIAFRDFLKDVKWEDSSDYKNVSHITPMHLLDEIYAIWLEGDLPEIAVLRGKFHQMFELELSEMDRDVLVMKIDKWLSREELHSIPVGESPHVDRITAGIADVEDESSAEESVEESEEVVDDKDTADDVTADTPIRKIVPEEVVLVHDREDVMDEDADIVDEPSNDDEIELPDDTISENDVVDASDEDVAQLDEDVLSDDDPVETETEDVVSSDDDSSDDELIADETLEELLDEYELSEVELDEREGKTESGE